jgi:signal transduction histidine kinase
VTDLDDHQRLALLVHEVRSPTAALAAIVAALGDGAPGEAALRTFVDLSLAASRAIDRVVGDSALGSLELEEVDVAGVARAAVASAALGGARVRLGSVGEASLVLADRVRIRQVLDNLIENAVAASGPDSEVVVAVSVTSRAIVIAVADLGAGIPIGDQERIFEPGVRLAARGAGSGLGLTVVRAVAEAHGGTATVESSPGGGATFTVTLPRAPAQPAGTAWSS